MIPKVTQDYLEYGALKGNRNDALKDAACQLRDDRWTINEAKAVLIPRATKDGLAESEVAATIKSIFNRPPREPIGEINWVHSAPASSNGTGKPPAYRKVTVQPEPMPRPMDDAALRFLEAKFKQNEFVSIGQGYEKKDDDGSITIAIEAGKVRTRETWIADIGQRGLDKIFPGTDGLFVRVNPMKNADGKCDKDVSAYRDILIEADEGNLEFQLGGVKSIGLPIATNASSGARSIHSNVRIDAPDMETYKERFGIVRQYCVESLGLKVDIKNANPSRYTRMPGAKRARRDPETNELVRDAKGQLIIDRQTLLEVNIPGKPWQEWFETLPIDDGARRVTVAELRKFDRYNDPRSMFGTRWACAPGSVVIQGPSGIGKSSLAMQWIICAALGRTLLDIPCFKSSDGKAKRIVVIQAENDDGDLAEPYQDITKAMNLTDEEHAKIEKNVVFLYQDSRTGKAFIEFARRRARELKPHIILADPLLSYVGADAIQQSVITDFLRIQLNPIIREFALLWIWIHHTGKPRHDGTEKTHEEKKYAGLSSSELTNWTRETVTMTELPENKCELSFGKRWRRTGILGSDGFPAKAIQIQQSNCGTVWETIEGPQASGGFKAVKSVSEKKKVLDYIIETQTVTRSQLEVWATANEIGINKAVTIAKALVDDECVPRVYSTKLKGKTNSRESWTIIPPIL